MAAGASWSEADLFWRIFSAALEFSDRLLQDLKLVLMSVDLTFGELSPGSWPEDITICDIIPAPLLSLPDAVTNCDSMLTVAARVMVKAKSAGNLLRFRLNCWLSWLVETP